MTDAVPEWTDAEIRAFCARIGLEGLDDASMDRLRWNANKVTAAGRALPRMARKEEEPANRVSLPFDRPLGRSTDPYA